ncbi:ATP-binding cassette domain-containing protein [Paenarthrobacter aurescens]|uniref:ATP-binding cassette domain-containing protein n=1 Tax=Paenarthrobacter aurescens TaxID=43663 RepID=UPI0021BFE488|nr:ABC transporter ATP-binding protein [Paenarthrobacter aurescens]
MDSVLDLLGLAERAGEQTKKYSGGMKRRLNIGIGLLHRPRLLILDEPTVGVDPQSRNSILEAVGNLSSEGTAVLYTTHYMEEAERLCDRIAILDQGRVQAEGTRDELITLTGGLDQITLVGTGRITAAAEALRSLDGVHRVTDSGGTGLMLTVTDGAALLAGIVTTAARSGMTMASVAVTRPDLESVFLHLTGKALRD